MTLRIGFARWRSPVASGGNRYDDEITAGLRSLGVDLQEYDVTGPWPVPAEHDRQRFADTLPLEPDWLVDNIVGSAAPEAIAAAVAAGRRVTMVMHYFPADDPALSPADRERLAASEAQAVAAATRIVATSMWGAEEVAARYGRDDVVVAVPGVDPAPLAPGSVAHGRPPTLLWLGRVTETKDPLTFLDALTRLGDVGWTARLVGPDTPDADLTHLVHERITAAGLADRAKVVGAVEGDALAAIWADTDLLVHTSRAETYGMVVSEALARGIPAIVAAGTGAVEAQQVGTTFPPGDAAALAAGLRSWLTDSSRQRRWRDDAAHRRGQLPTWRDTSQAVLSALTA